MIEVKICGIRTLGILAAAAAAGARYAGFVFYGPSPRSVGPAAAAELARQVPTGMRSVGLFVDPGDDDLDDILRQVPLDLLQLHGEETPERVAAIRAHWSIPVMKAIRIASPRDLDTVPAYAAVADRLLFDAKLPANVAALPGGNGVAFDWTILAGRQWDRPWILSGGLTEDNVAAAIAATGAATVDVSSGVEERPGVKSAALVRGFIAAAQG
jgi:phosphoribosylanthranilate isomerase